MYAASAVIFLSIIIMYAKEAPIPCLVLAAVYYVVGMCFHQWQKWIVCTITKRRVQMAMRPVVQHIMSRRCTWASDLRPVSCRIRSNIPATRNAFGANASSWRYLSNITLSVGSIVTWDESSTAVATCDADLDPSASGVAHSLRQHFMYPVLRRATHCDNIAHLISGFVYNPHMDVFEPKWDDVEAAMLSKRRIGGEAVYPITRLLEVTRTCRVMLMLGEESGIVCFVVGQSFMVRSIVEGRYAYEGDIAAWTRAVEDAIIQHERDDQLPQMRTDVAELVKDAKLCNKSPCYTQEDLVDYICKWIVPHWPRNPADIPDRTQVDPMLEGNVNPWVLKDQRWSNYVDVGHYEYGGKVSK